MLIVGDIDFFHRTGYFGGYNVNWACYIGVIRGYVRIPVCQVEIKAQESCNDEKYKNKKKKSSFVVGDRSVRFFHITHPHQHSKMTLHSNIV
jgi:hypothetical protein